MPPRKRRRSVAFAPTDDDDNTSTREVDGPSDDAPSAEEKVNSGVWNSFREEYHEGIFHFVHHPRYTDETSSRTTAAYIATRIYPHPRVG